MSSIAMHHPKVFGDLLLAVAALAVFSLPLLGTVRLLVNISCPSHGQHAVPDRISQRAPVLEVRQISLNYSSFTFIEPRFVDAYDRVLFYKSDLNVQQLQPRPHELLHGTIVVIPNGTVHDKIDCGWRTKSDDFTVPSKRRTRHFPILCPLLVPNSESFQHFLDGTLPKLIQMRQHTAYPNITYLLHRPRDRIILDILKALGVQHQVEFYQGGSYSADYLISTCNTPPVHPELFSKGRELLTAGYTTITNTSTDRPVILLTRVKSRNIGRIMVNQMEVISRLQKRYGKQLIIFKGGYSLQETVSLFSRARTIIGVHGGAFYNALFSPSGTHVVEIMPTTDQGDVVPTYLGHTIIWNMADMLNQSYWRIAATPVNNVGNVDVNIDKLIKVLDEIDHSPGH